MEAEVWLQELKNTAEFTANQALYEKAALEQQAAAALNGSNHHAGPTSLSATAAAAAKVAMSQAAIRAANAEAQVGTKGHLSLDELMDYINKNQPAPSSKASKKAKAKRAAVAAAAAAGTAASKSNGSSSKK